MKHGYKKLCSRKKVEENIRWVKRAEEAKREGEVWEIANRERRKGRRVNEEIEDEEWKEYFMRLLGRVEEKVVRGVGRSREEGGEYGEEKIKR